ncbi:MAG TPA: GNAT family N-acetyltransferase [Euzebya sp.]|nr:GNAT family N-acetyltransferase [Euzebya sp.]
MAIDVRVLTATDRPAGFGLRVDAFTAEGSATWPEEGEIYMPDGRRVGAFDGDLMVGHAGAWDFGQWFGGRRVPMAGVAGVIVRPEARGSGIAGQMVRALLQRCLEDGDVIACQYPTVPGLYRRLGWEAAGVAVRRTIATAALTGLPVPDRPPVIRPLVWADDVPAVAELWDRDAARGQGRIARSATYHLRMFEPDDGLRAWVAERDGRIVGVLQLEREPSAGEDPSIYRMFVDALVAEDHDTWLALWRLVGQHAAVSQTTRFISRPHEPLQDHLHLPAVQERSVIQTWMARLLDAPAAMSGRGWPAGAEVSVVLRVGDPLLPGNDGTFLLRVAGGGTASLTRTDRTASASIDIGALSALYTGHVRAADLAWQGRLVGASHEEIAALDTAFAAPQPWMHDHF